jgi:hypothetical protein
MIVDSLEWKLILIWKDASAHEVNTSNSKIKPGRMLKQYLALKTQKIYPDLLTPICPQPTLFLECVCQILVALPAL